MTWIRSRSTSSWILVRACAGTPPLSPTKSSTLRPASVLLRSFRYCTRARSMSMPPEASGPVFTVMRPRRIGAACAFTGKAVPSETAPAAWTNRLRLKLMSFLLDLLEKLLVGDRPAQAARDVLQPEDVQVVTVHARDAVRQHHHAVIEVERGERGVEDAGVGVDAHQHDVLDFQCFQKNPQIRAVEAVQALLVVDDVVALAVELRDDLRPRRALDVVLAHRAPASRCQAVGLALRGMHRLPERRHHAFAADTRNLSVDQDDVDHLQVVFS